MIRHRSLILDTTVRLVFDAVLVFSLYLLFAGHNQPGGGFVGGLVAAAAVALRYLAGGLSEVRTIFAIRPWTFLSIGLLLAVGTAIVPLLFGAPPLDQAAWLSPPPPRQGEGDVGHRVRRRRLPRRDGRHPHGLRGPRRARPRRRGARARGGRAMTTLLAITAGVLFATGTYLLLGRQLSRLVIGIGLLGHGANILIVLSGGGRGRPAFVGNGTAEEMTDPLPQALVLTAIVITFAVTAFLLAMAFRSWLLNEDDDVEDDVEDRRVAAALAEAEDPS